MRTLYIDCGMGAAGDMLAGALFDLIEDKQGVLEELNNLKIPNVSILAEKKPKCGINGIYFTVKVNGEVEGETSAERNAQKEHTESQNHFDSFSHHLPCESTHVHSHVHVHSHLHGHVNARDYAHSHAHTHDHAHARNHDHDNNEGHDRSHDDSHHNHHRSMQDIESIINKLNLSSKTKKDILNIYKLIAEAESDAHGIPVSEIHFHEVGMMDAIADITAVCVLMDKLSLEKIIASPVHVGSGYVRCAHGILPVPAPATVHILKNVPIYGGEIKGELCTPTGAALLKYFVDGYGSMPIMTTEKVGYGHGKKDFERLNSVRAVLGEVEDQNTTNTNSNNSVCVLSCNLDDMTPEEISFAMDVFFTEGALDVYTVPIGMKKSRPGVLLSIICNFSDKEKMINLMFKHTSTLGIRETTCERHVLERSVETLQTPYGEVRQKISQGYGVIKKKLEYEDLAEIAKRENLSLKEVKKAIVHSNCPVK